MKQLIPTIYNNGFVKVTAKPKDRFAKIIYEFAAFNGDSKPMIYSCYITNQVDSKDNFYTEMFINTSVCLQENNWQDGWKYYYKYINYINRIEGEFNIQTGAGVGQFMIWSYYENGDSDYFATFKDNTNNLNYYDYFAKRTDGEGYVCKITGTDISKSYFGFYDSDKYLICAKDVESEENVITRYPLYALDSPESISTTSENIEYWQGLKTFMERRVSFNNSGVYVYKGDLPESITFSKSGFVSEMESALNSIYRENQADYVNKCIPCNDSLWEELAGYYDEVKD